MRIADKKTNLYIGALIISIFLYLSFMQLPPIESLEKLFYEIEMRLDTPRNPEESKVALVNIDDKSIDKLGQWPWPRYIIAEMIAILKDNGAKVIGFDIIFSEKEHNPAIKEIKQLYDEVLERSRAYRSDGDNKWVLNRLMEITNGSLIGSKRSKNASIMIEHYPRL